MLFQVVFRPSARKDIKALPKNYQVQVAEKIEKLGSQPNVYGAIKLHGVDSLYRIRVGDYRIVYQVNKAMSKVVIVSIKHRRDVYRNLSEFT